MRDKLIEIIKKVPYGVSVGAKFEQYFCEKVADHLLDNGVIQITRCKDCKHCDKYTKWNNKEYFGCSWNGEIYEVEAEHYCGYGERRTEDDST